MITIMQLIIIKVLQLKSDYASFNLGVIHFDQRKYDIAETIFNAYLETFGNDLEAERYLLQLYLITSQDKAEALSKKLCDHNPNEAMLWYERGRLLFQTG